MKEKINILQIGLEDWSSHIAIPDNISWHYIDPDVILPFLEERETVSKQRKQLLKEFKAISELKEKTEDEDIQIQYQIQLDQLEEQLEKLTLVSYQVLILSDRKYHAKVIDFGHEFDAYRIFYPQDWEPEQKELSDLLYKKVAHRFEWTGRKELVQTLSKALFKGQYGAKFKIDELELSPQFEGKIWYEGQNYVHLEGEFGKDFQQIAFFRYNLQAYKEVYYDIYFEHGIEGDCDLELTISLIQEGTTNHIVQEWKFHGPQLKEQLFLDSVVNGYLFFSVAARGQGKVKLGSCHHRWSRNGLGEFVLGGERLVDQQMQEIHTFFNPMDFTPPLCVYFSGFRTAEGFEGYRLIRSLNKPFMLICDPRLIGGGFYLGSDELEAKVVANIQEKLDYLGFDNSQLILSGISMGTFGATYYGTKLSPGGIVISKPVLSLGTVALREKFDRPGGFATSLELLHAHYGDLTAESADRLNQRYWSQMKDGIFKDTTISVAYMRDEDYDRTAFEELVHYSKITGARIHGRGFEGRHNDGGNAPTAWFEKRYRAMIETLLDRDAINES